MKAGLTSKILLLAFASTISACSGNTTDRKLLDEVKFFTSTALSVKMTATQWQADTLPDQFARRAITAANIELAGSAGRAASRVMELEVDPRDLLSDMTAAMTGAAAISQAVEKKNRAELKSAIDALDRATAKLRAAGDL